MIPITRVTIEESEKNNVLGVLNSGMLAQGPKVKELEERFAKLCGTKHAIAVNSGTAALHTALYSLGVSSNDEVITVPFTFVATANCIIMQGAKPVFVDIEEDTFNMNPSLIDRRISNKTKAILPVHLYGQPYDSEAINNIAKKNNLFVLEDCAQAVDADIRGKKVGSLGDAAAFSFYATKNMMTGEGGMVTTDNDNYAELCRRFRHHGQSEQTRYEYYDLGYNYRMMDLQAAIGLAQIERIHSLNDKRISNAKALSDGLSKIPFVEVPYVKPGVRHVFHQYTIKVDEKIRDKLKNHLTQNGVGVGVYYPKPLHLHPFFRKLGYKEGDFPVSEKLSKMVLSLPCHPGLSSEDINTIINTIKNFRE